MMKKIILIVVLICILPVIVFGITDEESVELPNGISASDTFDSKDTTRWSFTNSSDWYTSGGKLLDYDWGSEQFAYQTYDYNNGALKSTYYRFELEVEGGRYYTKTGFAINDNINFTSDDSKKIEIAKNNRNQDKKNRFYTNLDGTERNTNVTDGTNKIYKYVVELTRKEDTNDFEVDINVYDGQNWVLTKSDSNITLNQIYISLWVPKDYEGKFRDFKAYYIPVSKQVSSFTKIQQDGDIIELDWVTNQAVFDTSIVVFSKDSDINFDGSDSIIYSGSSSKESKDISITSDMKQGGYFGVIGKSGSEFGVSSSAEYVYLDEPSAFGYGVAISDKKYKFNWEPVDLAEGYVIKDGSYTYNRDADTTTITLSNISNPGSVTIEAVRPSSVGTADSYSTVLNATFGNLDPVSGFYGTLNDGLINLNWDSYNGADEYILVRNNGLGDFSVVADDITSLSYQDALNNEHVQLQYKLKAKVSSVFTNYTDIVAVLNVVKNIEAEFDDSQGEVDLSWDAIADATSYKVYISTSSVMTNPLEYTTTENDYSFDFLSDDTTDRYVQIEAINGTLVSSKNQPFKIDYSRNNPVTGLTSTYNANDSFITVDWDDLANAIEYKVYVGETSVSMDFAGTISSSEFIYTVKTDDPDRLYFKVQGVGVSSDFILSQSTSAETYTIDLVQNLSLNVTIPTSGNTENHDATYVDLHWSELFRSDKYIVEYDFDPTIGDSIYTPIEVNTTSARVDVGSLLGGTKVYFRVKGIYGTYDSSYSMVVDTDDVGKVLIDTANADSVINKYYNKPMEFSIDLKIGEDKVYDSTIEVDLHNIFVGTTSNLLASYVYPQITSVTYGEYVGASFNELPIDHNITIKTGHKINNVFNPDAGYKVIIEVTDVDESNKLIKDKILRVNIKTDLRFNTTGPYANSDESILYNSGTNYKIMELPFHILDQIAAVELAISNRYSITNQVTDNTSIDVLMSYATASGSSTRYAKYFPITFEFKNKNAIIGE
jgi:hypothetical protein